MWPDPLRNLFLVLVAFLYRVSSTWVGFCVLKVTDTSLIFQTVVNAIFAFLAAVIFRVVVFLKITFGADTVQKLAYAFVFLLKVTHVALKLLKVIWSV